MTAKRSQMMPKYAPALEGIHELAGGVQALAHHHRLLAYGDEGIFQEPGLVFGYHRRGHRRKRRLQAGWCWSKRNVNPARRYPAPRSTGCG